ncbi:MAG: sortase, partial [Burkholderiales bacterium PBB5]
MNGPRTQRPAPLQRTVAGALAALIALGLLAGCGPRDAAPAAPESAASAAPPASGPSAAA